MATKTFDKLKQLAIQIRDEKTNKQNTANRVGTAMLEGINKLEQDYYDKTAADEEFKKRDDKLIELANNVGLYNVDKHVPLGGGFYTSATARAAVPSDIRKIGLIITYKTDVTTSVTEQFIGSDVSGWTTDANWKNVGSEGGNKILEWKTDAATTRKKVPVKERKAGMQISYKPTDSDWVNEQYVGTSFTDTEWVKDSNWEKIPKQKQLTELEYSGKVCSNSIINECLELYIAKGVIDATKVRFQIASNNGKLTQISLYNADSSVNEFIGQVFNNQGLVYNEVIKFTEMNQSGLLAYVIIHDYAVTRLIESLPVNNVYLLNNVLNSQNSPNIQFFFKIKEESEILEKNINGISKDLSENYIQKKTGKNLFNSYDVNCIIGKYIGDNGDIVTQELVSITGRMPVRNGQIIKYNQINFPSTYWNNFFLFDENDNLLDKHNGQSYMVDNERASYLRMNIYVLGTDAWDTNKPVGERNQGFPNDLMVCIVDSEDDDLGEYEVYVINTDIQRSANDYTDKKIVKLKEEIKGETIIKQIPCVGNSLTMGAASGDYFNNTYPARLQQFCEEKGIKNVKFTNCGVGGETIAAIAARQGAIPMLTKDDITIPSSNQESVNVSFKSAWGGIYERFPEKTFTFQGYTVPNFNNIRINPCYIGGVEGELSFASTNVFSFKRKENGTEKTIKTGTPIICNMSKEFHEPYAAIFEVGANGCYDDTQDYLAQVKACVNYYNTPNYIVIGCHYVTDENTHPEYKSTLSDRKEQESAFIKEFGVKFFNLRRLLNEYGIEYAKQLGLLADDYVPTEDDTTAISKGQCPPVFLSDGIHFNEIGYNLKAHFIFDRMIEIGIL